MASTATAWRSPSASRSLAPPQRSTAAVVAAARPAVDRLGRSGDNPSRAEFFANEELSVALTLPRDGPVPGEPGLVSRPAQQPDLSHEGDASAKPTPILLCSVGSACLAGILATIRRA